MSYDPLLAEQVVRGEYTLAYEAAMASRIITQIIAEEKQAKSDPQVIAGRVGVLTVAQTLLRNYAMKRIRIVMEAGEDMIPKLSTEVSSGTQGTGEDHRGQSQGLDHRSDEGEV